LIILNFTPFEEGIIRTSFVQSFFQWTHSIDNNKCRRLLEKLGFIIVGKQECLFRGSMYLHDLYELELLEGKCQDFDNNKNTLLWSEKISSTRANTKKCYFQEGRN